jgi:hypothetical protein
VIAPQQRIRRRIDGIIDIDTYRQQALAERAPMLRSRKRRLTNTLIAVATTLALAGALVLGSLAAVGMVHAVSLALSGAA